MKAVQKTSTKNTRGSRTSEEEGWDLEGKATHIWTCLVNAAQKKKKTAKKHDGAVEGEGGGRVGEEEEESQHILDRVFVKAVGFHRKKNRCRVWTGPGSLWLSVGGRSSLSRVKNRKCDPLTPI